MAVAVDTISAALVQTIVSSGTNTTAAHNSISASASLIMLFLEAGLDSPNSDATIAYSTMTLGGSAFTHLASAKKQSGSDGDTGGFLDIYYMTAATLGSALPSGNNTLSITPTYTGGTNKFCGTVYTVAYTGSDLAAPFGTAQVSNGQFVSSLTLTDTLASGDLLVGACGNGSAAPTVTTGSSDGSSTGATNTACHNFVVGHNSGSGSISLIFGTNSGDYSGASGVKIVADGGGGGGFDVPLLRPPGNSNVYRM